MILDVWGFGFGVRDFLVRGSGFLGFRFVVPGLAFRSFWFSRFRGLDVRGFAVWGFHIGVSRYGVSRFRFSRLVVPRFRVCGFVVRCFRASGFRAF